MRSCVLGWEHYLNIFIFERNREYNQMMQRQKKLFSSPEKLPVLASDWFSIKRYSLKHLVILSVSFKNKDIYRYVLSQGLNPEVPSSPRGTWMEASHSFLHSVQFSTVCNSPQCAILHGVTDPPLNGKVFHGVGRFGGLQGFLNYQLAGQPVYYRVMEGDIR